MFLVFRFLRFLCKFAFSRTRGGNKEWFFHRFFCIHPHYVTMTEIESRDFALIFSRKCPFNTLSQVNHSEMVIVTIDFYLHSAQEMLIWNSQCLKKLYLYEPNWIFCISVIFVFATVMKKGRRRMLKACVASLFGYPDGRCRMVRVPALSFINNAILHRARNC